MHGSWIWRKRWKSLPKITGTAKCIAVWEWYRWSRTSGCGYTNAREAPWRMSVMASAQRVDCQMTHEAFGTILAEKHFEQLDRAGWEYSVEATRFSGNKFWYWFQKEGCTVGLYSRQAISSTTTIQKSELIAHHMEDGTEWWKVECLSVTPSISWSPQTIIFHGWRGVASEWDTPGRQRRGKLRSRHRALLSRCCQNL